MRPPRALGLLAIALSVACAAPRTEAPATTAPPPTAPGTATATAAAEPSATAETAPRATPAPSASAAAGAGAASAIRFVDTSYGWLGLDDGILATSDGGKTWRRQLRTTDRVRRVWSFDRTHAWAQTADRTVYRTSDGEHWAAIPPTTPPIAEIQFVTPLVGWAIAMEPPAAPIASPASFTGTLLASTDGGEIWRTVPTRELSAVCFADERNGWGAAGKRVFRTSDAGRTWALAADLDIHDQGPWIPTIACRDMTAAWVQVTEPFAALSHAPYLVFHTTDAGRTWKLEFREPYTLGSITPQDTPELGSYPSTVEVLRDGSVAFVTCTPPLERQRFVVIDPTGGRTEGQIPSPACLVDAQVIDARHVVAVRYVPDASLVRTDDAGATWSTLTLPP